MQNDAAARSGEGRAESQAASAPTRLGIAAGAVFVAIAVVAACSLYTDPYLGLDDGSSDPGAAFVPWIAVWILGLGGLGQIGLTLFQAHRAGAMLSAGEFTIARLWLPIALIFTLLVYLALLEPLGFLLAGTLISAPWIAILHWRSGDAFRPYHALLMPLEAALIVGAIYAVFRYAILVPLP